MKKSVLLLILLFGSVAYSNEELPLPRWYVRAMGGWNFIESPKSSDVVVNYDDGFLVGGALGFRILPFLKIESEFAYRENNFDSLVLEDVYDIPLRGHLSKWTWMGNVLIDFPFEGIFLPCVGFGVGYMRDDGFVDLTPIAGYRGYDTPCINEKGLAWQVICGMSCEIFRKTELKLEYHYLHGPHIDPNHAIGLSLQQCF